MTFRPILPAPAASASAVRLSSSRGGRLPGCTALLLAVVSMLAARAVRNKKKKSAEEKAEVPRGPYIKPFGPTFDASELPYFKYRVTTQNLTSEMEILHRLFGSLRHVSKSIYM